MNKITKLIMPILGSSVVAGCLLPLASCNKQATIQVTEDEWKEAIGYMCGYSEQKMYWKFSNGDKVAYTTTTTNSEYTTTCTNVVVNHAGLTYDQYSDKTKANTNVSELFVGPLGYSLSFNEDKSSYSYSIKTTEGPYHNLATFFKSVYLNYASFEYKNGCYSYVGEGDGTITHVDTKLYFGSNKKLVRLETNYVYTIGEHTTNSVQASINFDYNVSDIIWNDALRKRVNSHYFEFQNSYAYLGDTSSFVSGEGIVVKISGANVKSIVPNLSDYSAVSNLFLSNYSNKTVFKNGEILSPGWSVLETDKKLYFEQALTPQDEVYIKIDNIKVSEKISLQLLSE